VALAAKAIPAKAVTTETIAAEAVTTETISAEAVTTLETPAGPARGRGFRRACVHAVHRYDLQSSWGILQIADHARPGRQIGRANRREC
jgi:hypothetical protein